jgi:MFS family permease
MAIFLQTKGSLVKTAELNTNISPAYDSSVNPQSATGTNAAWTIIGCAWLFYIYEYVLRVSPGVIEKSLMIDFGVTATIVGTISGAYYWSYVPLQVPCGVIADRLGARRVIVISSILCIMGCLLFASSSSVWMAISGRVLMGAGSACAYICCTKVAAEWFSNDKFAILAGIGMFMGTLGGSFNTLFSILVDSCGWRDAMFICALVGVGVCVLAWTLMTDAPKKAKHPAVTTQNMLDGLKMVARNPQSWLLGLYGCAMYLPLCAFAELWGVPYLTHIYQVSTTVASRACVAVFLGMGLGSIASAWLSNKIQSRKKIMSWAALGTLACFLVVFFVTDLPFPVMCVVLFLGGLMSGGQTLYFTAAKENTDRKFSATAVGFTNALVMCSAMIFQPLLGKILDVMWSGEKTAAGLPYYTIENYQAAFTAVALAFVIGWVLMQFVTETYVKDEEA